MMIMMMMMKEIFGFFGKKDRWGIYKSFLTLVDEEVGLLLQDVFKWELFYELVV